MKTLLTLVAVTAISQIAYGINNIKASKKLDVKETHVNKLNIVHNNQLYIIDVVHTNIVCGTSMPNALASTKIDSCTGERTHKITIQDSLINTDMYDAVLNHEIGHIVLGHTVRHFLDTTTVSSIFKREYEADAYAVSKGHIEGMIKFRMNSLKYTGMLPDYNQACLVRLLAKKVFN